MPDQFRASIVILTKNAGISFRDTLEWIYAQQYDGSFELIVVDSGSTDGTLDLVKRCPARLVTIQPAEFNFGRTRNHGFSLAQGGFIVTISQDVVPCDEHWLARLVEPFSNDTRIAAVQGRIRLPQNSDIFYWERRGNFYFTSDEKRWMDEYKCGMSFVNCAIRKSFWQDHQLEGTPFSEDKLYQKTIHDAGFRVEVAPEALCYHGHQYSFRSLVTRLKGEGAGWKYAGLRYTFADCLRDIVAHKWMLRQGMVAYRRGELVSFQELLFPVLRPLCLYLGNRAVVKIENI